MTIKEFCLRLMEGCAVAPGAHVLVAVSGGADSTALLCFFAGARASYPLTVSCAHVEHGIRGEAAREDLAFVRALCMQKGTRFMRNRSTPRAMRAHMAAGWRTPPGRCATPRCGAWRGRRGRT